jgi:hypothetical protein
VKNRWNSTNTIAVGIVISNPAAILIGNWVRAPRPPEVSPPHHG